MLNDNFKGHLAAITANIFFGLNISVAKALFSSSWMTPIGLTITRMSFGFAMFWIISFFRPREKIAKKDLLVIAAGSFLGLAFSQITFTAALLYTTPVIISLIAALSPIIVLLLSALFLKDPLSYKKTIGVVVGISGALLIVIRNNAGGISVDSVWGTLLAFISVTSYASYLVIIRKTAARYSPVTMMKWMYLFSLILLAPFGFPELPKQRIFTSGTSLLPWLELGYVLLFSTILAFFLTPVALKRIKATTVSMYINLQPLVASTAAIAIGQDFFSWDKPLALILIVAGVFLVTRRDA